MIKYIIERTYQSQEESLMLTATNVGTILLVSLGTSAPLIAWAVSALAMKSVAHYGRSMIVRSGVACIILLTLSLVASLALVLLLPVPLAQWAILTFITLAFGLVSTSVCLYATVNGFYNSIGSAQSGTNVHPIAGARSAAANDH